MFFFFAFSCKTLVKTQIIDVQNYRFNGIYSISEDGYKIFFYDDSSKFLLIDTIPIIGLKDIMSVKKEKDKYSKMSNLTIKLTDDGTKFFAKITKEHINEKLPVILNDKLVMAPIVMTEISGGELTISGYELDTIIDEFIKTFDNYKAKESLDKNK